MSAGAGPGSARDRPVPSGARPILVVGYGNPLRSDDGVGPAVAARLAIDPRLDGVDVRIEHQLTPELALDASLASLLVLVDAGVEQAAGEVSVRRLEAPAAGEEGGTAWTHHLDPQALVGLARALWNAAPPVVVVSVGPASLEMGDALTPVVEAAVGRAVEAVADVVEAHRRGA